MCVPCAVCRRSAHLTNDAVQKKLDTYHTFEDHCKMDMAQLQAALGPHIDIQRSVWPAMREAVAYVFGAALPRLNPRNLQFCWELLGLDFMIDAAGQTTLIEVNTSPALFRAGPVLADLLPRVIEECVQKCIDPYFPPPPGLATDQLPQSLDGFEEIQVVTGQAGGGAAGTVRKVPSVRRQSSTGAESGRGAPMVGRQGSLGAKRAPARVASIGADAAEAPVAGSAWR